MKELKAHIKNNEYKSCYLFYGEENYLKKYYETLLKKAMILEGSEMMNMDTFEGKSIAVDTITDSADTLPFMSDKRLVIIKKSELFETGRKDESEKMNGYIANIPESTCMLFIEDTIDKRSKLYKSVQKVGHIIEFTQPKENELVSWIQKALKKNDKNITSATAIYMLRAVGADMELLEGELQKLAAYKKDDVDIKQGDIDAICTKSLETKIFDMLDAIGNKRADEALEIYNNMLTLKESPIKILTMVIRQFRLLYQTKYLLGEGYGVDNIANRLAQRPFVIKALLAQVKNFSNELLLQALEDCLDTDLSIKTGKMSGEAAVELLIIKYSIKYQNNP